MGLLKVLGIIFLLIIAILAVVGVDGYMTYNSLKGIDPQTLVSQPKYVVSSGNDKITLSVSVALPKGGFIPKGIKLTVNVNFDGELQTKNQAISLGDNKTISFDFTLTQATVQKLVGGGSITVSANIKVVPVYFVFQITPLAVSRDLGSQTITGNP